jgi:hypothetical protein
MQSRDTRLLVRGVWGPLVGDLHCRADGFFGCFVFVFVLIIVLGQGQ